MLKSPGTVKPIWVLAIDTATPRPGIALAGEHSEDQYPLPTGRQASEALLPCLESTLASAGLRLNELSRLAVCAGPGSFTGIRVGLATAWGLSRALSVPIETFGSLEAVAELARAGGGRRVCAAFPAERGDVYFGEYDLSGPRAVEASPAKICREVSASDACAPGTLFLNLASRESGGDLPVLAAARAVRRAPGPTTDTPRATYVRLSAAEEFHGVRPA